MKKMFVVFLVSMSLLPQVAQAGQQTPAEKYAQADWAGELIITTAAGTDTFQVWLDEGPVDETGKHYKWRDGQAMARIAAINSAPKAWDKWSPGASYRYFWARNLKDQQYHPLESINFLIVNVTAYGPMPLSGRPTWRASKDDIVTLTLADGRQLTSLTSLDTPVPRATVYEPGSVREQARMQLHCMLGWRILYRPDEMPQLWGKSPCYADRQLESVFLVPVPNGGRDIRWQDIAGVTVHLLGHDVVLRQPKSLTAERLNRN